MKSKVYAVLFLVLSVLLITGCGTSRRKAIPIAELPIVHEQNVKAKQVQLTNSSVIDSITVNEAVSLALNYNPSLQVFLSEIEVYEARTMQESLLPNPELEFELENFGGTGALSGFKGSETTIAIGQLIELGGKRSKRTKIAAFESDIVLQMYEIKRLNIITQVRSTAIEVLLAQKKVNLQTQLLELSQSFKSNIDTLVSAGRLSNAESARAQVELFNRKLALNRSIRELNNARRKLSGSWGMSEANFIHVKGNLIFPERIPVSERVLPVLENSPLISKQKAILKKQKVETELANAMSIPDPVLSAGYRRFNESDDQAIIAGISLPIPLFDRNQGGRQEAHVRERQSEKQIVALSNQIQTEVNNRLETIKNLSHEIESTRNVIIPEAQKAYDIIYQNYRLGKYALIDVLDAQRQLFNAESSYLDILAEINLDIIALEGIIGKSLESL
jgi:cobalt-zinc-cadmium efflux system outer membrane protein